MDNGVRRCDSFRELCEQRSIGVIINTSIARREILRIVLWVTVMMGVVLMFC